MDLGRLVAFFETSPAVRLLRAQHAPFVTFYLHDRFKRAGATTVPHAELVADLSAWLDEVREVYPADAPKDRAEQYLAAWCSGDTRWLARRFGTGHDGPLYELSPHAEQVLGFLDDALAEDVGFVATESRLHLVIDTLENLVVGASRDPAVHLDRLRAERDEIDERIAQIESDGVVAALRPAAIRDRFATAVSLLKQLQGDFRAVEERFREIAAEVRRRQSQSRESRGSILGDALDAEDALKQEDQGVSFFEFLRFIHSPAQQERVRCVVRQVGRIPELAEQKDGLDVVGRMVPSLLAEAAKVAGTTRQLSSVLRRLLDVRSRRERQRVAELLRELRGLAAELSERPPRESVGISVDVEAGVDGPMNRALWSEPAMFDLVDLVAHSADPERRMTLFRGLAELRPIDWRLLRSRVRGLVAGRGSVTLAELLAAHPPETGVLDLVAYLQIAVDDGHLVSHEAVEEFVVPARAGDGRPVTVTLPLVTFVEKALR